MINNDSINRVLRRAIDAKAIAHMTVRGQDLFLYRHPTTGATWIASKNSRHIGINLAETYRMAKKYGAIQPLI